MFAALWTLNLAVLVGLAVMAWSPKYGAFRGSAVNPLIIFVVFSLFFNINFAVLHGRGTINIFERGFPVTPVDTFTGYIHYSVVFMAAAVGLVVAQLTAPLRSPPTAIEDDHGWSKLVSGIIFGLALLIGVLGAYKVLLSINQILSGRITRQVFFLGNPLLTVALSVICPGLAIFLSARRPTARISILATLVAFPLLLVTGTRGVLIFIGIIYLINLVSHGRRVPAYWYLVLVPVMAYLLAISRYLLRSTMSFRSFGDFVENAGGFGNLFFNTAEVAMAEAITVISTNLEQFSRPPFESMLGLLMYPLPRSVFTFKPQGAAGYFTDLTSPLRWQTVKSEILPTGYGDLIMQFGPWAGAIVAFALAFFWLRACIQVINSSRETCVIWLPFLTWWLYIFLRGAIFNVGASVWPFTIILLGYKVLQRIRFNSAAAPTGA